jgi:hypothetical protein
VLRFQKLRRYQIGAWNPLGGGRLNIPRIKALGTQHHHEPVTGIDQSQGPLYAPDIQRQLDVPQDLGLNVLGFINPYSLTFYSVDLEVSEPVQAVPPNQRRVYLILQNQGPGNIWINFGQGVTVATVASNSNGLQLIQTQVYEQIGGGYMNKFGESITQCFVSPDYLSATTDQAGTTLLVGEGVWRPQAGADLLLG